MTDKIRKLMRVGDQVIQKPVGRKIYRFQFNCDENTMESFEQRSEMIFKSITLTVKQRIYYRSMQAETEK